MALNKTEHLGLSIFPQSEESTILVRDVMRALASDQVLSNMNIIDDAIYELQKKSATDTVWSDVKPDTQLPEDVWNEILNI